MPIKIGVIGLGYWGPNLVRNYFKIKECEIVYCCDLEQKQLKILHQQYPNILLTNDPHTVINKPEIDAIVLATPSNTHYSLANEALAQNKHVFVEKPMTLSAKEAKHLVNKANKKKKLLMVGHTYEYHPAVKTMKQLIAQKEFGEVYYIYCSRLNMGKVREETNALWNLAPHDISVLHYLLDNEPLRISAFGMHYLQKKHEDVVFINLRFPGNTIAHIHVSWLDPSKERKITVIGSKQMIIFDDLDNESPIKIYDKAFIKLVNEHGDRIYKEYSIKLRPGDIHAPYIEPKEPLEIECNHFINSIINHQSPQTDGINGYKVVKILEAAQKSLNLGGKWINVK